MYPCASFPPEIWQHIFLVLHSEALDAQRNDLLINPPLTYSGVVNTPEICLRPSTPITLSHVCRAWRSLSLGTPDLWNSIFIGVPCCDKQKDATKTTSPHPSRATNNTAYHASAVLDATQAYLLRSADMPLNIILMVQDNDTYLDRLISHSYRWRSLHVTLPTPVLVQKLRHSIIEPHSTSQHHDPDHQPIRRANSLSLLTSLRVNDQSWELSHHTSRLIDGRFVHPYASPSSVTNQPDRSDTPLDNQYDITFILSLAHSLVDLALPTYPIASFPNGVSPTPNMSRPASWTKSTSLTHLSIHANPSETNVVLALLAPISMTLQSLHLDGIGITRDDLLPISHFATPTLIQSTADESDDDPSNDHYQTRPLLLPNLHTLALTHPTGRRPLINRIAMPCLTALLLSGRAPSKPDLRRLCVAIREAVLDIAHLKLCDLTFRKLEGSRNEEVSSEPKIVYLPEEAYDVWTKRTNILNQSITASSSASSSPNSSSSSSPSSSTLPSGTSTPYSLTSAPTSTSSSSPYYTLSGMFPPMDYHIDPSLFTPSPSSPLESTSSKPTRASSSGSITIPRCAEPQPGIPVDPLLDLLDISVSFEPSPYPMFASSYGESEYGLGSTAGSTNEVGVNLVRWFLS